MSDATYGTEQEAFWAGEFGNEYIARNRGEGAVASNLAQFSRILRRTDHVESVLEIGANIGLNLRAISQLLPSARLSAVEINETAAEELASVASDVFVGSAFDFETREKFDLVFTKGVLIHIAPERLDELYERIHRWTRRYLCFVEYYNPSPLEVEYRGHARKLFKRDFAGEVMDRFSDLRLRDYGFTYHRDPVFPADDITWFLMEKA